MTPNNSAMIPVPTFRELADWLRGKIADAEKTLKIRQEMAATWRTGSNKEWEAVGNYQPKKHRLQQAEMHDRIAVKLRRELFMFQETLRLLDGVTDNAGT